MADNLKKNILATDSSDAAAGSGAAADNDVLILDAPQDKTLLMGNPILAEAAKSTIESRRAAFAVARPKQKSNSAPAKKMPPLVRRIYKNQALFKFYIEQGFINPSHFLMLCIAADTATLASKVSADKFEVLKFQMDAATRLLPYELNKPSPMPLPKDVSEKLHVFIGMREQKIENNSELHRSAVIAMKHEKDG